MNKSSNLSFETEAVETELDHHHHLDILKGEPLSVSGNVAAIGLVE